MRWVLKRIVGPLVGGGTLVVIILAVAGVFATDMVGPETVPTSRPTRPGGLEVVAERVSVPVWYEAVGSFRSRTRVTVAAQVTARIVSVTVAEGDAIAKNRREPLVHLDDREFQARLNQARRSAEAARAGEQSAKAALESAKARLVLASKHLNRIKTLRVREAATPAEEEKAESSHLQAQAAVSQANQGIVAATAVVQRADDVVKEAAIAVGYTKIHAPKDVAGVVADRRVDPGDLAVPGKPLLVIHDPKALRLEAHVREGLIGRIKRGQTLTVVATALGREFSGTVDEVVPSVDPISRSVRVKVAVPAVEGLYPGMFGKLRLKLGERTTVLLPGSAIRRVGQLEIVRLRDGETWVRRLITTGKARGDRVEVLSGLAGGEVVAVPGAGDEVRP